MNFSRSSDNATEPNMLVSGEFDIVFPLTQPAANGNDSGVCLSGFETGTSENISCVSSRVCLKSFCGKASQVHKQRHVYDTLRIARQSIPRSRKDLGRFSKNGGNMRTIHYPLSRLFQLSLILSLLFPGFFARHGSASEPPAATTLSDRTIEYAVAKKPYAVLTVGDVTAVVSDNRAVDDDILPGHRSGYSGIASLTHAKYPKNMFVPDYAGLNFEHVLDGTNQERDILFGPRRAPMELRLVNSCTAELYQKASLHYGLESCTRYQLLDDGTIEMTFECIPRKDSYHHNYISLFWASYINQPESLDIHFKGFHNDGPKQSRWIRGITPRHGELSTHLAATDHRNFLYEKDFPLTLVFNFSNYRYTEPWYYGVNEGMAFVLMFRPEDQVRITQSPSGGGSGNPAWDFQFLISDYQIDQRYQFKLRAMYVPYESSEQIETITSQNRKALGQIGQ